MRRRQLLSTLAGSSFVASAGCAALQSCEEVTVSRASVTVEYWCEYGPSVTSGAVEGTARGCSGPLTIEFVEDGEVTYAGEVTADGRWSLSLDDSGHVPGPGDARVRVRDGDGELVARAPVDVDHYWDEPDLGAYVDSEDVAETHAVGDEVVVGVDVTSISPPAEYEYEVQLLVDGEPVERARNEDAVLDCGPGEPEHEFAYRFEEPGEVELTIVVEPLGVGSGTRRTVATVTVREE